MAAAFTTMSLNDGAGSATSLSRLRSSTAWVMSTVSEIEKSGAVAFDSAMRRATVCWRRVSSWTSASPLAPASLRCGSGARSSAAAGAFSSSRAGASTAAAPSPAPSPSAAAWTSALTIRPPGPLPSSRASSTPSSRAMRRATGEALTRSPSPAPLPLGARVLVAAPPPDWVSPPPSPAPAPPRASPWSRFRDGSGLLPVLASLPRRLRRASSLAPRRPPPASSSAGSSSFAAGFPFPPASLGSPIRAITSPMASVSPSWATTSISVPSVSAS